MRQLTSLQIKILLISAWTIFNFIQAFTTELAHDEAYYWLYSEFLDYGYFDHPPVIAFMIKAGYLIFQNELGVRLITVLFSSLTLLVLDELTERRNFKLLFAIFISFTCFHIYGFIATPDSPLIFCTALFFLAYKRYLESENFKNTLFLSASIALLLYAKYHGILILFFVILSNIKLLTKRSFYAVTAISILLYVPHILWQIDNNYPSYQYHVQNRNQMPYKVMDTLGYVAGLILIISPLLFPLCVKAFRAFMKTKNDETEFHLSKSFKRSLIFIVLGFSGFFLITTLNTRAEANWNIPVLIPLILILVWYAETKPEITSKIYKLSGVTLVLFLLVRTHLVFDLIPAHIKVKDEFHGNALWASEVEKMADGLPVVFSNSYQNASKHSFYTKNISHSHNNPEYRRNQFDLWPIADSLLGEKVFFVGNWDSPIFDTTTVSKGVLRYRFIEEYKAFPKLKFKADHKKFIAKKSDSLAVQVYLENQAYDLSALMGSKCTIVVNTQLNQKGYSTQKVNVDLKSLESRNGTTIKFKTPKEKGKYYFTINVRPDILPETINSELYRLDVTD